MDELLAEIMRRAGDRWGDDAPEGPYCRQEITEGVREVLDGLKADAARIVDRAAGLVMDDLAREAASQAGADPPAWRAGDVVPMGDLVPRAAGRMTTVWVITTHTGHGEDAGVMGVYASPGAARTALEACKNMLVYVTGGPDDPGDTSGYHITRQPGTLIGVPADGRRYPHVFAVAEPMAVQG